MMRLTADELSRFMICSGSHQLQRTVESAGSEVGTVTMEGRTFHWLAEARFNGQQIDQLNGVTPPGEGFAPVTQEMIDHAYEYVTMLHYDGMVEQETSWQTETVYVGGRADYMQYDHATGTLTVADAKYGYRRVSPVMHWPMMSHAIGFAARTGLLVKRLSALIFQPRAYGGDMWSDPWVVDHPPLRSWQVMIENQVTAQPETRAGLHCVYCKAAATCATLGQSVALATDMVAEPYHEVMSGQELAWQLKLTERLEKLLDARRKALVEMATHRIKSGQVVQGFGLKTQMGHRAWLPGYDGELLTAALGVDLTKKGVVTPAEAERRGVSKEMVSALTQRPITGSKLAEIDPNVEVAKIFGEKS